MKNFNEPKIKKTLIELAIYSIFLITATISKKSFFFKFQTEINCSISVAFGHVSQSMFYSTDMLNSLLVNRPFRTHQDSEITFKEIETIPDLWMVS